MKKTIHECDFCGGEIQPGDRFGTLTVPLSQDDKKLKKRTKANQSPIDGELSQESLTGWFTLGSITVTVEQQQFDVCDGCVSRLLRARVATVAMLQEAFRR